jgi:hypothetical protein
MNFGDYELSEDTDANTAAELIKHWLRGLKNPVFPVEIYSKCVSIGKSFLEGKSVLTPQLYQACKKLSAEIPHVNNLILCRLAGFFKIATDPYHIELTKMSMNSFAIVIGPNCLRSANENLLELAQNIHNQNSFFQCYMEYKIESGESFDYSSYLPS